jgi:hypothetical protein
MVAMNSIPQHEVANGKGQSEFALANPTALSNDVAKNPAPSKPSGLWLGSMFTLISFVLKVFISPSLMRLS